VFAVNKSPAGFIFRRALEDFQRENGGYVNRLMKYYKCLIISLHIILWNKKYLYRLERKEIKESR